MKTNNMKNIIILTVIIAAMFVWIGAATASLLVAPIRVVFSERSRSATVLILNTDTKVHTYRMGWKLTKMKEDGSYTDLPNDENDPYAVSKMVIVSPKQIVIQPDGRQNIRLSLRKPADLPPGEYRGHLVLETVPESELSHGSQDPKAGEQKGVQFGFQVAFGVSIPIIIRNQVSTLPDMKVDNINLAVLENPNAPGPKMTFDILRSGGNRSPYGRIDVLLDNDGKSEIIGQKNNVAIFNDIDKRSFRVDLKKPVPAGSRLTVVYKGGEEYAGQVLAQRTFDVD